MVTIPDITSLVLVASRLLAVSLWGSSVHSVSLSSVFGNALAVLVLRVVVDRSRQKWWGVIFSLTLPLLNFRSTRLDVYVRFEGEL